MDVSLTVSTTIGFEPVNHFLMTLSGRVSAILARTLHLRSNSKWWKRLPVCEYQDLPYVLLLARLVPCISRCKFICIYILYAWMHDASFLPSVWFKILTTSHGQVPYGAAKFANSRDSPFRLSLPVSPDRWTSRCRHELPNWRPGYRSSQVKIVNNSMIWLKRANFCLLLPLLCQTRNRSTGHAALRNSI